MNTLILDCSAGMSVFLISGENEFSKIDKNQKKHTDELLVTVDELLKQANILPKEIDNIGVCVGPGSFTGIRVAVSICKGLAIESKMKIFVCSNFDIYSFEEKEKSIFVLDGFSDFIYTRIFDENGTDDKCESVSEFAKRYKENFSSYSVFVQSEKLKNVLNNFEISSNFAENKTISCFKSKILNNETIEMNQISPIYLRASQAEIERNKKLNLE